MRSDLCSAWAGLGDALRQPSSGVPGPPEVCKDSSGRKLCGVARLMTRCRGPNERQPPASHYAVPADSHGEAHGSAMFELRERDELPQPCQSTTEDGHLVPPCKLQSGNSKETKQKFVARTHRERSAQRDAITPPRHRSAARCHICCDRRVVCPEKKVGHPRAGLAGRACAASGPRVSAGCWRARQLRVFTGRELVAGRASGERSPGARARRRPRARRERSPGERWVLCRALAASFYRERARRHA